MKKGESFFLPAILSFPLATLVAAVFYFLWLSEVIPALMTHTEPKSVVEAGLMTNPVHVLDLAILLPALLAGGVSLFRRGAMGYYLAPLLLTFTALMAVAIGGMVVVMVLQKVTTDLLLAGVFGVITLVSTIILWLFLRRLEEAPRAEAGGVAPVASE